jgi:hypothetical protein
MSTRVKQAGIVSIVVLAAAQLVRPERANPPTDSSRTLQAQVGTSSGLVAILDRACGDCHSNGTMWPWFTHVAPVSWLMSYSVTEGRNAVNFSEWAGYPPELQRGLLAASCRDASEGTMPGVYTLLRPRTRLSIQDVEIICEAASEPSSSAKGNPDRPPESEQ